MPGANTYPLPEIVIQRSRPARAPSDGQPGCSCPAAVVASVAFVALVAWEKKRKSSECEWMGLDMQSGKCNMASKALNRPKQMRAPTEKGFLKSPPQKTQPKYFHSTQWKICTSKRKPQLDSSNSCVGVTSSSGGKVSAAVKMYVLFPYIYTYIYTI